MSRATERFKAEIRKSHRVYSYVDVVGPTGETQRLRVSDGYVNVDRSAQYRRAMNITAVDPLGVFVPDGNSGILTPFGTEVRPYRGVKYDDDGTIEVYPLGVFRLSKTTVVESSGSGGGGAIGSEVGVTFTLEGYDRSRVISRNKFLVPYTIPTGTNLLTAIQLIIALTFPDAQYDAVSTSITTTAPQLYDAGNDPWTAVTDLATSMGCEIYFNVDGWVVIAPPTDIDAPGAPVFTYIEGQQCTVTDLQAIYADDPGFNGVIVTGASVGNGLAPVRAVAWDTEPSSPTYYLGPYGSVPQFIQDQNVTTVAQAQAEANSLLKGQIGFSAQLTLSAAVNPSYEAGDVIQVERQAMHTTGLYVMDAFDVQLKKDNEQTITARQRRTVA